MHPHPDAASIAVFSGKGVLLIKRARRPFAGCWTLPGGRREADETAEQCIHRELEEELGLSVEDMVAVTQFAAAADWRLQVFASSSYSGAPQPNREVAEWGWFSHEAVADLNTTPHLERVLDRCRRALKISD